MTLEEMQDAKAKPRPPADTIRARNGGLLPSFAELAQAERKAAISRTSRDNRPQANQDEKNERDQRIKNAIIAALHYNGKTATQLGHILKIGENTLRRCIRDLETDNLVVAEPGNGRGKIWTVRQKE